MLPSIRPDEDLVRRYLSVKSAAACSGVANARVRFSPLLARFGLNARQPSRSLSRHGLGRPESILLPVGSLRTR